MTHDTTSTTTKHLSYIYAPPAWPGPVVTAVADPWTGERSGDDGGSEAAEDLFRASVIIPDAVHLGARELARAVSEAYRRVLGSLGRRAPLRFWNYIPDIHRDMGDGVSRYMVFNEGRFEAISDWLGVGGRLDERVSTATGIGYNGRDLAVHCLAGDAPGSPVENPRQIPAYRYSKRYGPVPPCFARATIVDGRWPRVMLVGGTASVRGERSAHEGDLAGQIEETLTNLAALVRLACTGRADGQEEDRLWLARMFSLRVYCAAGVNGNELERVLEDRFPAVARREIVRATICRPELSIEIEGAADVSPGEP
jgi:chorismate lyase/3-hydroxybenzoate synthase